MAQRWTQDQPGAKAPGQRPPRPGGRWPLVARVARVLVAAFRAGGGKRSAFPVPARTGGGTASLPWQGPPPLPQRHADPWPAGGPKPPASARPARGGRFSPAGSGAGLSWCGRHRSWGRRSARAGETHAFPVPARTGVCGLRRPGRIGTSGVGGRPAVDPCIGMGHRPCHSATLTLGPPGAQSPRQVSAPPSAGASRPPGRALAFCFSRTCPSSEHRLARAGKRGAFPVPARTDEGTFTAPMAGAIAPATAPR